MSKSILEEVKLENGKYIRKNEHNIPYELRLQIQNNHLLREIIAYLCKRDNTNYEGFRNIINSEV